MITAANSLFAVKKLVYDDKVITMKELKDALAADFEGEHARIRKLAQDVPKYGNDIDEPDLFVNDHFRKISDSVMTNKNPFAGPLYPGYLGITAHYYHGIACGATPDGRKARTPFADGSFSTYPGTDKRGPTAVIKSATKTNLFPCTSNLFNLKFHPSALKDDDGIRKVWDLVKVYSRRGGYHIQFNVVDQNVLLEARERPREHKDLLVRVAGFSAYFVDLAPLMQDEIIAGTEHIL